MEISFSNHMFGREVWDKLPECIFENFETAWVKREQFQILSKIMKVIYPKISRIKHAVTG